MDRLKPNQPGENQEAVRLDPFEQLEAIASAPTFGEYSEAAASLTCCAQIGKGYIPTMAIDYSDSDNFTVRAASLAGGEPRLDRRVRQDSFAIAEPEAGLLIIAVADGLGSLPDSHLAASFACQVACSSLTDQIVSLNRDLSALQAEDIFTPVNDLLFKFRSILPSGFATTLVVAAIVSDALKGPQAWLARIGDSTAATLSQTPEGTPLWQLVFGGEENSPGGIATTKTHAIPSRSLKYEQKHLTLSPDNALFLFTDGLSIPLELGQSVREGLGKRWFKPPSPLNFASHLSFNRRGELDDRTCVGVWLRP